MANKDFEGALLKRLSGCDMDADKLRLHVRDIVELQKAKVDILDSFPMGKINPDGIGVLARTKFDELSNVLKLASQYPSIRHIELFPYGIPFPIWWDVRMTLSDRVQNRF